MRRGRLILQCGWRRRLRCRCRGLIVQELQVVGALVPFIDLAVRTRSQVLTRLFDWFVEPSQGRPIRLFYGVLERLESLKLRDFRLV